MAIDPLASALDALVEHLAGSVTMPSGTYDGVTARRGWPEHGTELDLSAGIVLAVTAGRPQVTETDPLQVDHDADEDLTTYMVGRLEAVVQLDVWAPYELVLDAAVQAVAAQLDNALPFRPGLFLTQADYFSRPLRFERRDGPLRLDQPHSADGDWRATWTLGLATDLVAQVTQGTLTQLDIQAALNGVTTTTSVTP